MHVIEKNIWIDCPPESLFDFHANHANRVGWHDHVTRSQMITPMPIAAGSRFEIDTITANRHLPMEIEITSFDRPRSYSYRSFAANAVTDSHQTFAPENGGTRFGVRIELNFNGLAKPFGWLILKLGLERHFEQALEEIKAEMEKPSISES